MALPSSQGTAQAQQFSLTDTPPAQAFGMSLQPWPGHTDPSEQQVCFMQAGDGEPLRGHGPGGGAVHDAEGRPQRAGGGRAHEQAERLPGHVRPCGHPRSAAGCRWR